MNASPSPAPVHAISAPSYRTGTSDDVLHEVRSPGVNIAVWNRSLPAGLTAALAGWVAGPDAATYDRELALEELDAGAPLAGFGDRVWRTWLQADLASLAARFATITRARRLRLTFGPVRTDQCRKFHVDWIRFRLVSTYVGPGTQWVSNEHVRRDVLDAEPRAAPDHNRGVVRDLRRVRHAQTGAVVLMKGEHSGDPVPGVVHRSPPIEALGVVRVVVVLTTADVTRS